MWCALVPICRPTINSPGTYACSCLIGNCSALSHCCGVSVKGRNETCVWWVNCVKWTAECCLCSFWISTCRRCKVYLNLASLVLINCVFNIQHLFFMFYNFIVSKFKLFSWQQNNIWWKMTSWRTTRRSSNGNGRSSNGEDVNGSGRLGGCSYLSNVRPENRYRIQTSSGCCPSTWTTSAGNMQYAYSQHVFIQ